MYILRVFVSGVASTYIRAALFTLGKFPGLIFVRFDVLNFDRVLRKLCCEKA